MKAEVKEILVRLRGEFAGIGRVAGLMEDNEVVENMRKFVADVDAIHSYIDALERGPIAEPEVSDESGS